MALREHGGRGSVSLPQVAVAGEIYIDLIFSGLDEWPQPGKEIFAKSFHRELGGGAAITASALASLGTECSVFACVGADTYEWVVSRLAEFGVGNEVCMEVSELTAITVSATQPHDRAFLSYAGANRFFDAVLLEAVRTERHIASRHVHMAFPPQLAVAQELVQQIHAQGCTVSLDVGWREDWLRDLRSIELLQQMDIFFPNEAEARCITGLDEPEAMLKWFAGRSVDHVVLKLGAQGAAMLWDGEICIRAGHPVTAVDTTGAGDCFDAGFLHGWLNGVSPSDCMRAANVCGALSTEALGGLNALTSERWLTMKMQREHS